MIKRFIIDDSSALGGRISVVIVSGVRDEMVAVVDQLAKQVWTGRVIYYDPAGHNGVDVLINPSGDNDAPYEYSISRSISWGPARTASGPVLAEVVRNAFALHPFGKAAPATTEDGLPRREAVRPLPPAPVLRLKDGQLALF